MLVYVQYIPDLSCVHCQGSIEVSGDFNNFLQLLYPRSINFTRNKTNVSFILFIHRTLVSNVYLGTVTFLVLCKVLPYKLYCLKISWKCICIYNGNLKVFNQVITTCNVSLNLPHGRKVVN